MELNIDNLATATTPRPKIMTQVISDTEDLRCKCFLAEIVFQIAKFEYSQCSILDKFGAKLYHSDL